MRCWREKEREKEKEWALCSAFIGMEGSGNLKGRKRKKSSGPNCHVEKSTKISKPKEGAPGGKELGSGMVRGGVVWLFSLVLWLAMYLLRDSHLWSGCLDTCITKKKNQLSGFTLQCHSMIANVCFQQFMLLLLFFIYASFFYTGLTIHSEIMKV